MASKRCAGKVVRLLTESVRSQRTAAQAVRHMKGADQKTDSPNPPGSVVDLFCGAGGLAHGLLREGFHIAAGVDVDPRCRYPFEHNNAARFILRDVDELQASEIVELFEVNQPQILVGCAPCQAFSLYNQKNRDPSWKLVKRFCDLVLEIKPDVVSMENVPRLIDYREGKVFRSVLKALREAGYTANHRIVYLPDYGLPQRRSRLVMMASLHGTVEMEPPTYTPDRYRTVEQAIGSLPALAAGETDAADELHTASRLSPMNLRRIRASTPGGSWAEWEEALVTQCHRIESGRGYRSVYGRMQLAEPSPTITTQFFGFGNGRFGHPEQDRALTLREGAILQSFPGDYRFVVPGERIEFKTIGRMIGNAVPVLLGQVVGRSIASHLVAHGFSSGD